MGIPSHSWPLVLGAARARVTLLIHPYRQTFSCLNSFVCTGKDPRPESLPRGRWLLASPLQSGSHPWGWGVGNGEGNGGWLEGFPTSSPATYFFCLMSKGQLLPLLGSRWLLFDIREGTQTAFVRICYELNVCVPPPTLNP